MTYKTTGKLIQIGDVTKINSSLKKREVLINRENGADNAYPNLMFELLNTDVDKTNNYKIGDHVTISFVIHGKSYTPPTGGPMRYFTNLRILSIEPAPEPASNPVKPTAQPVTAFDNLLG